MTMNGLQCTLIYGPYLWNGLNQPEKQTSALTDIHIEIVPVIDSYQLPRSDSITVSDKVICLDIAL